ncbi:MAG: 16S rRNA (cytosine(1402)-N(4))-methyltransferase [Gammaproteobacteria bacterium]|nr:MAG: 16S rRNA (cytosine(1402)-N(4))-methyltransferase [Gammaproteobacteria bacterium]RLA34034.1 MAG: 16S rRNA (cytosine(1402)-N(4))-methyltransferase [Gammaproteobacteria bacterium]
MKKERRGSSAHVPVLLDPVIAGLNLHEDGLYIDGTFGRGGHSRAILNRLGDTGRLLAIDRDPQAIAAAADALKSDPRFELMQGEFSELKEYAIKRNLLGKVDGLLFDLGVSSPQLDEAERGFSFQSDGPLDMRMDPTSGSSAADWLANVKERDLRKVLFEFGEERFAVRIARAIVAARALQPIRRTAELAKIVSEAVPSRGQKRHPATKTFQAIRIRVNDELQQLEQVLRASTDLLRPGGRLCVISFHSLEDRRVKRFMREASRVAAPWRGLPEIPEEHRPPFKLIGKMISATDEEIEVNVRSRSARLRVAERL